MNYIYFISDLGVVTVSILTWASPVNQPGQQKDFQLRKPPLEGRQTNSSGREFNVIDNFLVDDKDQNQLNLFSASTPIRVELTKPISYSNYQSEPRGF